MSNSLDIWPNSPMPTVQREIDWGGTSHRFATGRQQSSTAQAKPLFRWNVPFTNVGSACRALVYDFYTSPRIKGDVGRFLMKDPDDFLVSSAGVTFTTGVNTFFARDKNGYSIIPASGQLNIVSVESDTLTNGVDYTLDQDTGIMTYVLTPSATDSWSVQSTEYFRKCKFSGNYRDASPRVWAQFNIQLQIEEVTI